MTERPELRVLGWRAERDDDVASTDLVARVGAEHRGYYDVYGLVAGEPMTLTSNAAVTSTFRRGVESPTEYPAVGDWVVVRPGAGHRGSDAIDRVLPRASEFVRRAPGREPKPQVVGANIDVVLIVTAADGDLSPRRLERYLAVVHGGGADPVIVVSKADIAVELDADLALVADVAGSTPVHVTSLVDRRGVSELAAHVGAGRTVAFVGSSGVGKSSLTNALIGESVQDVQAVREDGKGRHTTIRRELLPLDGGGFLLDTPGMREVQLWEPEGLPIVFDEIAEAAMGCRFSDCEHKNEPACAVRDAVASGAIDPERLASMHQLSDEVEELTDALEERRQRRGEGRRPDLLVDLDKNQD